MNYNYKGITSETLMLLEMNKFNNNKPFYEQHKKEINEGARQQLGALTLDLADSLYEIDESIVVNPKKVSRIRRDTRFSKDKTLYRSNVWCIWHRAIEQGESAPGLWCEVGPGFADNGVGLWATTPSFMEFFRKSLIENPEPFLEAFVPLVEAGFAFSANRYKRDKPGTEKMPDVLKAVYNQKELYFIHSITDMKLVASPKYVDYMKEQLKLVKGMYIYLDNLSKSFKALNQ